MFLGGLSQTVIDQIYALLPALDTSRVFVCCSGSFRSERTIHQFNPASQIFSNDVSLFSCVLGHWLADEPLEFRFKDELAFLEDLLVDASPTRRAAAVVFALEVSDWASGSRNPYKESRLRHLVAGAPGFVTTMQAKLAGAFGDLRLAGFAGRDWVVHMDAALAEGASVVAFPPFYKGGYEKLYAWMDARVDWARPTYNLYDPKTLPQLLDRVREAGAPYIFIADQQIPGHDPKCLWYAPGRDCWLYASGGEARFSRWQPAAKPFFYHPLDPDKLTADSKIQVEMIPSSEAMYVRQNYTKKSIFLGVADFNFVVYLDGMLAGVIAYTPLDVEKRGANTRRDVAYLLSDMAVTRERRVSKLIVRLALNRHVMRTIEAKTLRRRLNQVETTAFSEHPVSMKYRGLMEITKRQDAVPPQVGYKLQLVGDVIDESPQAAYDWWWRHHGRPKDQGPEVGPKGGRSGARRR